jgi:hypothetical protein
MAERRAKETPCVMSFETSSLSQKRSFLILIPVFVISRNKKANA